jgi:anti-sigma regulatory factor (Ser/Thr protein kinase)
MPRPSRQNPAVRDYILRNVEANQRVITSLTAKQFGLSRTAIARYMRRLIDEGFLTAEGKTKSRKYALKPLFETTFRIEISPGLSEDGIWRFRILENIKGLKQNVLDICQYGFTEILNNVIDHSGSKDAVITFRQTYADIEMMILDHGIGIFEKIQRDFNLADPRSALLELSKGRITSDATRHSGEGIFFASRMFDRFRIGSGKLYYTRRRHTDTESLIEIEDTKDFFVGTSVHMNVLTSAETTPRQVFERYEGDEIGFRKTHVPILLGQYPGEQLVSRSQAKRILSRFDKFSEVFLDFQGVEHIGQAFADEIFRVFKNAHPEIGVIAIHTVPEVSQMIANVQAPERGTSPNPNGVPPV